MGEKLKASPLIEAICQFTFKDESQWNWTLPGRLYDNIKTEFPHISEETAPSIIVSSHQSMLPQKCSSPSRVILKKDESSIVQIGPHFLSINKLREYSSWIDFYDIIKYIYKNYLDLLEKPQLARIGLRYIHEIKLVNGNEIQPDEWITLFPSLKGPLKKPFTGFYQRFENRIEVPEGAQIIQTGLREVKGVKSIIVDIDCISIDFGIYENISNEIVFTWIQQAHEIIETFKSSIPEKIYKKFRDGNV